MQSLARPLHLQLQGRNTCHDHMYRPRCKPLLRAVHMRASLYGSNGRLPLHLVSGCVAALHSASRTSIDTQQHADELCQQSTRNVLKILLCGVRFVVSPTTFLHCGACLPWGHALAGHFAGQQRVRAVSTCRQRFAAARQRHDRFVAAMKQWCESRSPFKAILRHAITTTKETLLLTRSC